MVEKWRDIKGYEGRYQVSNKGQVKSLARDVYTTSDNRLLYSKKETLLKASINRDGYSQVRLMKEGVSEDKYVHRIVAKHFIKKDPKRIEVNHIDGIKANNNASNLEWSNRSENIQHAFDNSLITRGKGKDSVLSIQVDQFTMDGEYITTYNAIHEAARETGASPSKICCVCKGRRRSTHGYRWRYTKEQNDEPVETIPNGEVD